MSEPNDNLVDSISFRSKQEVMDELRGRTHEDLLESYVDLLWQARDAVGDHGCPIVSPWVWDRAAHAEVSLNPSSTLAGGAVDG